MRLPFDMIKSKKKRSPAQFDFNAAMFVDKQFVHKIRARQHGPSFSSKRRLLAYLWRDYRRQDLLTTAMVTRARAF